MRADELTYVHLGFGVDAVEYREAWQLQREIQDAVVAGERPDTCLLLEHQAVYTAGRRTQPFERPVTGTTPVLDVDRGGRITWHGPGQLVGYPIVHLSDPVDVVAYVRDVEEAIIGACHDLGLEPDRSEGRSGVWFPADERGPDRKVCAIGIRVSRGVTMHGFALNCDNGFAGFDGIVPCGLTDAGVTSLTRELGRTVTVQEMLPVVEKRLAAVLGYPAYTVGDRARVDA
jgi:lipoyl(octanoyl) transferase